MSLMIEIDGVRNQLHGPGTEAGDYISDDYYRMLDIATSDANRLSELGQRRLAASIKRLNLNLATTSVILLGTPLADAYDIVVEQVNDICENDGVGTLDTLIRDDTRHQQWSGEFKFR